MKSDQIKILVNDLVEKYGTRNPSELADNLDVHIQYGNLGDELSGCHIKLANYKFIYINDNVDDDKLEQTIIAHELGHSIMHEEDCYFLTCADSYCSEKAEIEANTFAAELLIPDEVILDHPGYTTDQLSMLTGYSDELISFKKISK